MLLTNIAYGLIFIGIILKTIGLYSLARKKDLPITERKKIYTRLNWPGNFLLAAAIILLISQGYF